MLPAYYLVLEEKYFWYETNKQTFVFNTCGNTYKFTDKHLCILSRYMLSSITS